MTDTTYAEIILNTETGQQAHRDLKRNKAFGVWWNRSINEYLAHFVRNHAELKSDVSWIPDNAKEWTDELLSQVAQTFPEYRERIEKLWDRHLYILCVCLISLQENEDDYEIGKCNELLSWELPTHLGGLTAQYLFSQAADELMRASFIDMIRDVGLMVIHAGGFLNREKDVIRATLLDYISSDLGILAEVQDVSE